ncbi:protein of unknown function DUF752 [Thalassoporum mexicanum PCC 7367]|uniref:tRNA (5-methylaminomethyl-2-thiouridine)(34)-methyltransferase MnmD n=1 Tax=Thalassoporum mexicanum TaxID=3457544 RepID=UPI00029FCA12|nr:MnmC family methyltransferase [Pseudanabaena sp. PCC 7367]AFY70558.1 protein of unknown function DUF752 [Pseudanabaena sp. PCC 7367]
MSLNPDQNCNRLAQASSKEELAQKNLGATGIDRLTAQATADGSHTFFSAQFQEAFHSNHGAKQEAIAKFVQPCQIAAKVRNKVKTGQKLKILDVCYGLGYNTAAALETTIATLGEISEITQQEHNQPNLPKLTVEIFGLESNLAVPQTAIAQNLISIWSPTVREILSAIAQAEQLADYSIKTAEFELTIVGTLLIGDARQTIPHLSKTYQPQKHWADAIFLDPFSPPKCPQLWTVEFLQRLANCLAIDGYLATYSCAAAVRSALLQTGLKIGSTRPVGRKSPGTIATHANNPQRFAALTTLNQLEQGILQTRASIPYRDPGLSDRPEQIITRRQRSQQNSELETSSSWKRRHPFDR